MGTDTVTHTSTFQSNPQTIQHIQVLNSSMGSIQEEQYRVYCKPSGAEVHHPGGLCIGHIFKPNTIIIQIKQLKIGCYDLIPFYLLLHPPTYTGCGRLNHSLLNVNKVNHDFCALTLTAVAYRSTTAAVQSILSSVNSGIKQKS